MNRKSEILRPATILRSVVRVAAIPALILGVGLLVSDSTAQAQRLPPDGCVRGQGNNCPDRRTVPEPSSLVQLGVGLFGIGALVTLTRKRLNARKS
jgi:hypothetical protein